MRGGRTLLLLLIVALPVGYFAWKEYDDPSPATDEKKLEKVFTVEADKIDEITIKAESGERTTLKKTGTDWKVVEPADGGAAGVDQSEISGITSNLATLEQQRVIDENAKELKEFGLAQPRVEVTFKAGGQPQTLQIGAKTPTGGDLYAKVGGQNRVFLIPSYLDTTFNRKPFDLREKSALKVDATKVDSMEVTTPERTLKMAKVNGAWQLTEPAEARSDSQAIDGLVSRVTGAQMKAVAPAGDLKTFGLDKPAVTVKINSGSSQATLLIGTKAEEGTVYAKDAARPDVFTIESSMADDLKRDATAYRQKDLFDARAFNTTKIEVVKGADTFAFEKSIEKDKDGKPIEKWRQTAPAKKDADAEKIATLLSTVTGARVTEFVAKPPASKPEITIALSVEGKTERVTFSRAGADAYAVREGSSGSGKIDANLITDIVKAVDALK